MISKEEFLALAAQKYEQIHDLHQQPTFYDYEKAFIDIWEDLGRQVLEKNLTGPPGGQVPNDRRKKKDASALRTHPNR